MQERRIRYPNEYSLADAVIKVFFTILVTLLCFYSSVWMAQDIFPEWTLSKEARNWICGLAVFTAAVYELGIRVLPYVRILPAVLVPAVYGNVCFRYAKQCQIDLEDGACALATQFLVKFNAHLRTSYFIWPGKTEFIGLAFAFWTLVILLGLLVLALILGKRIILLLLPVSVFAAELMVGFVPQWKGMSLFFAALLFACADGAESGSLLFQDQPDNRRSRHRTLRAHADRNRTDAWHMRWMPSVCLAGAAVLILLAGGMLSDVTVDRLMKKAPDILEFQRETEQNLSNILSGFFMRKQETVHNQAPHYTGKEMLRVTAAYKPGEDVLLKGFYGTDYRNGSWSCDTGKFTEACAREGYSEKEAEKELLQAQFDFLEQKKYYSYLSSFYESSFDHGISRRANQITIEHTGNRSRYAYLPYAADYAGGQGKEHLTGDVTVQKAWRQNVFTFSVRSGLLYNYAWDGSLGGMRTGAVFDWYDGFAQSAYLEVPDQTIPVAEYLGMAAGSGDQIDWNLQIKKYLAMTAGEHMDKMLRNQSRINLAMMISSFLKYDQVYSTELEPLPQGEDPVNYFLMESKRGYCVHFASAAALLLRQLGVPARYVSGYVARKDDFTKKGDSYVASVRDWDAHAWVEIYLENLGWIPVDVTPGIPPEKKDQNTDYAQNNGEKADTEETQTDTDETQTDTEETQTDTEEEEDSGEEEETQETGTGAAGPYWQKYAAAALAAVLFLLFCCLACLAVRCYHRAPEKNIRDGNYNKAVRCINRRLFWKLYLGRKIRQPDLPDRQYEQILKTVFQKISEEDWTRFMQAARTAAFAQKEIPKEEAEFCCQIYRTIIRKSQAGFVFTL